MTILNIGCGPVIPGTTPGIYIIHADSRAHPGAEHQDMEKLTYPDDSFDLVACINALDHTPNAQAALNEVLRVAKRWVYIDCALIQRTTSGKNHYWDALEDGTFKSKDDEFNIKDFGFEVEFVDNGLGRRYNHIIARYQNRGSKRC